MKREWKQKMESQYMNILIKSTDIQLIKHCRKRHGKYIFLSRNHVKIRETLEYKAGGEPFLILFQQSFPGGELSSFLF